MFLVVVLSLAALASAGPVVQSDFQQEIEDVNSTPFYKQLYYPYSANIYGNYRNNRYFPYYGKVKENYPIRPYNYNDIMTYPARSNYYLRYLNKPKTSTSQPRTDYDSQDIYHLHEVNHHHVINNVHDFKQEAYIRKLGEMSYPFLPYSPTYSDKYYNREHPNVEPYYGKSFEQEYVQPHYNKYWNVDYIRNLDYSKPITTQNVKPVITKDVEVQYVKPIISKNLDLEYVKAITPKNVDVEYTKPAITKNLNLEYVQTITPKNLNAEYTKPVTSKSLDLEYVQPAMLTRSFDTEYWPVLYKSVGVEYTKPVPTKYLDLQYAKPIVSKNLDVDYVERKDFNIGVTPVLTKKSGTGLVQPIFSRDTEYTRHPAQFKNLDVEYMQPIIRQYPEVEYVPEASGRYLDETRFVPNHYNRRFQQVPYDARFKRDVDVQVGTNAELKHDTPVAQVRQEQGNVETIHPVIHEGAATQEQIPQGVERQDSKIKGDLEHVPAQSEQHDFQQPIHRQTRGITTQYVVSSTQYVYYPYLDNYLPIQTPLVFRNAFYPNYYNLFFRK